MKRYGRRRHAKDRPARDAPPAEILAGYPRGRVTIELDGQVYEVPLRQPGCDGMRRPRSDTLAAQVDGRWLVLSLRAAALARSEERRVGKECA